MRTLNLHNQKPIKHMKNYTTKELKNQLRAGDHAWPGGYPLFFITSDGAALSFDAVRENIRSVLWSMRHGVNDGWRVIGCDVNWEDPSLYCDHTGARIPSAYAEEEVKA
jgi:hypothetical protein